MAVMPPLICFRSLPVKSLTVSRLSFSLPTFARPRFFPALAFPVLVLAINLVVLYIHCIHSLSAASTVLVIFGSSEDEPSIGWCCQQHLQSEQRELLGRSARPRNGISDSYIHFPGKVRVCTSAQLNVSCLIPDAD